MAGLFGRLGKLVGLPLRVAGSGVKKASNITSCALKKTGNFIENVGRQSNKTAKNVLGLSKGKKGRRASTRRSRK